MTEIVKARGTSDQNRSGGAAARTHDSMVRVDQAGEFGATRIYEGQLAVMGSRSELSATVRRMADQEERHREAFDKLMSERGVRPTLLQPFWSRAGYALGAVTALMGPKAAMACTVAVETEIDKHYREQLETLADSDDAELTQMVGKFREEELEHKAEALAAKAEEAPGYPVMTGLIRLGCRAAIGLSKRI